MIQNLGIIYNKDEKIVNHRSLIQVLFNPILRLVGFQIVTKYDPSKNKLLKPAICRCEKQKVLNFHKYNLEKTDKVESKRKII